MSVFPEEALDSYIAGTPVPEAHSQGVGSQCTTPLLSSALGAHIAAEWASRMRSGEWGNLHFSSFLSPLQVCLAFCPSFPSVHRKTCQKDQTPGFNQVTKKEQRTKISDLLRL